MIWLKSPIGPSLIKCVECANVSKCLLNNHNAEASLNLSFGLMAGCGYETYDLLVVKIEVELEYHTG